MAKRVYTVREFRASMKEALDLATASYAQEDDGIEIVRGDRTYQLFDSTSEAPEKPAPKPEKKKPEPLPKDLVTVDDKKLKKLFEGNQRSGDHCPHGYNLKVSSCKFGCKK